MPFKQLVGGAFILALMSSVAVAQDQAVIDAITQDLIEDGFTQSVRITVRGTQYRVEAQGASGATERQYRNQVMVQETTTDPLGFQVERVFDGDGALLRERVQTADGVMERQYQAGVMVSEQLRTGDGTGLATAGGARPSSGDGGGAGSGAASGSSGAGGSGGAGSGGAGNDGAGNGGSGNGGSGRGN